MPELHRLVPYKNYKFQVTWDTKVVAGVNKVGALSGKTGVVEWRAGGDPSTKQMSPGQTDYEAITLEQGVTDNIEFQQWANKVWDHPNSGALGKEVSLKDVRKDITITLLNEAGQAVMAWNVHKCWVSEFTALPELDSMAGNTVAIQSMTLQNEGWERDPSVRPPHEPNFDDPSS